MGEMYEAVVLRTTTHSPLPHQFVLRKIVFILFNQVRGRRLTREREHFSRGIMVSVDVSQVEETSAVFVVPGTSVNIEYYCEHVLRRGLLSVIQVTCMVVMTIGVDLGGSPGTCPPIIGNRPCIYYFLPPFPPIFWFAHPIFLTSLRQWSWLDITSGGNSISHSQKYYQLYFSGEYYLHRARQVATEQS